MVNGQLAAEQQFSMSKWIIKPYAIKGINQLYVETDIECIYVISGIAA